MQIAGRHFRKALIALWLACGFGVLFTSISVAVWVYPIVLGLQVVIGSIAIVRRRRAEGRRLVWLTLLVAIACSAISGALLGRALLDPSVEIWNTLGVALVVACLACYGLFVAMVVSPLMSVAELHRPAQMCLGGFAAFGMAYLWTLADRTDGQLVGLAIIAGLGAIALTIGSALAFDVVRRLARTSEISLASGGLIFAFAQVSAMLIRSTGNASTVAAAGNLVAQGILINGLLHPRNRAVGMPLSQLSDRVERRAMPIALGVLLLADGVIALLGQLADGSFVVVVLGAAALVQVVVVAWTAAAWFETGIAQRWLRNRRLTRELRGAMIRHEIVPYYQPIVRATDRACVGYEALARWVHPSRGVIVAADFLDLAESRGYLAAIDRAVLLAAARDLPTLTAHLGAVDPFVSINLSPRRLEQPGFADEVLAILAAEGLSGDGLVIEMTENTAVTDWPTLLSNLNQLQETGIGLAVDDFGSGHANVSLLCQLDIDMIKLDRELVELAMRTPRGAAVVHAAIRTGQATGALIVAEGVSELAWIGDLGVLGVDYIQGFGIGYPEPVGSQSRLQERRVTNVSELPSARRELPKLTHELPTG